MDDVITVKDLLKAGSAIAKLSPKKPPVKIGYALQVNIRRIQALVDDYEKTRLGLVQKYGGVIDGGFRVTPEHEVIYELELRELWEQPADLRPHKIPINAMADWAELEVDDYVALWFILDVENLEV